MFVLLTVWVFSTFYSGALRNIGRIWVFFFDGITNTVLYVGMARKCSEL